MWDILSIPAMREVVLNEDYWKFYQALYEAGFDINQDIEFESCYHRRVCGEVVYCPRVIGFERNDPEWMCSGYATIEAWKIGIGKRDVSLLRQIEDMSRESNFTGELCEYLESYWGEGSDLTRNIEVSV